MASDRTEKPSRTPFQKIFVKSMIGLTICVVSVVFSIELAGSYLGGALPLEIGGAILLVTSVTVGFLVRSQISRPLLKLSECIGVVSNRDYDVEIYGTMRRDEIGDIANGVEKLRSTLSEAIGKVRGNAFRSAAFRGSSAALMMVDEDFKVVFTNPTCDSLLGEIQQGLSAIWPETGVQDIIGADLSKLATLTEMVSRFRQVGASAEAMDQMFNVGSRVINVTLSSAFSDEGGMIGAVVEWEDLTQAQRNAAIIGAIDAGQIRIEFDRNGQVKDANDSLIFPFGLSQVEIKKKNMADLFSSGSAPDFSVDGLKKQLLVALPVQGRFHLKPSGQADTVVVEGIFTPVSGVDSLIETFLFLGSDVTAADRQTRAAEQRHTRATEEQQDVVAALGIALTNLVDGDLQNEIKKAFPPEYDKLRNNFNAALASLRETVGAVMQNSISIRNETGEITNAADDLSRRTERQAATLEETAAALDELTASVRSAAEGADQASKMSASAQKNAEEGGDVARRAVAAMDGIKTSSKKISKITSVIDDIAFQTNLLALNAGVEAARAGEAGRGFAVVATEVRALAQRSSDAAREINVLISSSGDQVKQGVELVDRTGSALAAIVTSVSDISKRVSEIASLTREQASGLAEINTAVNELDQVTQQNAAMFEETTAASHALTAEADALHNAVSRFRISSSSTARRSALPKPNSTQMVSKPRAEGPNARKTSTSTTGNLALKSEPEFDPGTGWEEF